MEPRQCYFTEDSWIRGTIESLMCSLFNKRGIEWTIGLYYLNLHKENVLGEWLGNIYDMIYTYNWVIYDILYILPDVF